MPSLRELQTQVVRELLSEQTGGVSTLIRPSPIAAASRLRIYQNNVRSNFVEALRSTYPVICRLVGNDYFRHIGWSFQRSHPSQSGDLNRVGDAFPDYLQAVHSHDNFRYLADVARLEWLIQDSLLSADHGPLDLQSLARLDAAAFGTLRFILHPTWRPFQSGFPALRIWETNVAATEPSPLDLDSGGECFAVMRHEGQLRFHRLSRGEYDFVGLLAVGRSFATAVEYAATADPDFDATLSLQRLVAANAIVDFAIHDTRL